MKLPTRSAAVLTALVTLLVLGCPATKPPAPPPVEGVEPVVWQMSKTGLGFRLSDVDGRDDRPAAKAKTTPLDEDDQKKLMGRLPPLAKEPGDEKDFALREGSQPPPKTGAVISESFPPKVVEAPPPVQPGPLAVSRHAPEGPVNMAPFLSVSFSQPMVSITSHDDLAKVPVPVQLSPVPPGKWRWAGSQTVIFDPDKRFPMATEYVVEVPAGTRSASGETLAKAERWTFTTPAPRLIASLPNGGPRGLDPIMYAAFDQAIDAGTLLSTMRVQANGRAVAIRQATDAEIAEDPAVQRTSGKAEAGRWIAFKAVEPLPKGADVAVIFPAGTPSAEGPRKTDHDQQFKLFTYKPLALEQTYCSWGSSCPPGAAWTLRFNNPLDPKKFDRSQIKVDPEPEGLKVAAAGNTLTLTQRSRGKTKYHVTVSGALADTFGQTLGREVSTEIEVQPAEPYLFAEEREMSVLDPGGGPVLPVFSVNRPSLTVRLYQVEPADWPEYLAWRAGADMGEKNHPKPPGKLVSTKTVTPPKVADQLVVTPVDLSPALHGGVGQVVAVVEPAGRPPKPNEGRQWVRAWIQVTKLGLEATLDHGSLLAWTTRLADGAPEAGVEVHVAGGAAATSGPDGIAKGTLAGSKSDLIWAKKGNDVALMPGSYHQPWAWGAAMQDQVRWFLFDDRHLYKPSEEVHVRGWLRRITHGAAGDVTAVASAEGRDIAFTVTDARNVEIGTGKTTVDASGGFTVAFKLPPTPNLGRASVRFKLDLPGATSETTGYHSFDIEEFRRPEFEVSVRAGEGPFQVGRHTQLTTSASYFAGGGLPNAEVSYSVSRSDASFSPPNRSDFTFGKAYEGMWWHGPNKSNDATETWTGRTNAAGEHKVRIDFDAVSPPYPMRLAVHARVTDVNRQGWSAETSLLVHPADVYVGLKLGRAFSKAGEPLQVDALVADVDGKVVPGRQVSLKSARLDWEYREGERVEIESDKDSCDLTSADETGHCALKTKEAGRYRLTAVVTDAWGRKNQTVVFAWVLGDDDRDRQLDRGTVEVIPSKSSYGQGETAELLVMAPFAPAEGLLVVTREGVVTSQRFSMTKRSETLRLPIDPSWIPNLKARVTLAGAVDREDAHGAPDPKLPKRPAFASGSARIAVSPGDRKLEVAAKPRAAKLEPGGKTTIDLEVKDARGAPAAGTTATLIVVDEAILSLASYQTPDPMKAFYFDRVDATVEGDLHSLVLVSRPEDKHLQVKQEPEKHAEIAGGTRSLKMSALGGMPGAPAPMASAMASAAPPPAKTRSDKKPADDAANNSPVAVRRDWSALALFSGAVVTDGQGRASVDVKLPDNLTRYRVMAVAVAGEKQFGSSESTITARLPLMVRPSAPRFLNYGDRFELPVVLQNQTDAALEVDLAARATNAKLDGPGVRVTVPANDRVEVRFPAAAAMPGKARFQIGAASGGWSDAAVVELPVWTPATTEAFATYGTIDEGAVAQPVKMPAGVVTDFGGLDVQTSSTAVSSLTDAVLYLVHYPFECNEQISSRVIAIAALRDVLAAFDAPGLPSKAELEASMKKDIERLAQRQHYSGGWDFWRRDHQPWPYLSVHVAHALQRAKEKGYAVPPDTLSRAQGYLKNIEANIPRDYSAESRRAIVAYALYVRKRMGDADPARARKLLAEGGGARETPLEAIGWIWPTLSGDAAGSAKELEDIGKVVRNQATETAGAAHFTTSYSDGAYVLLHSDRRADALLLEGLMIAEPKSDLIPKVVAGLLGHRKAGHWQSTQENAFVLLSLDRYFATYEKATPDFVAKAWLGGRFAGEHAFKGRTTETHAIHVPMKAVAEMGAGNVVVQKAGPGRLYYRVGMSYAPSDLKPPPADHGFSVTRVYEAVDDPADVKREADGTWRVKAGAKVRVRVSMVAPSRRYHVALVDPLPAGLEVMNPALSATGEIPKDPKQAGGTPWWWSRPWYEHQNLRDERAEAFASLLWDGVYDYTYVAVATTPGTFVVPPPKAEEMYAPETFGRGAGDRMIIE